MERLTRAQLIGMKKEIAAHLGAAFAIDHSDIADIRYEAEECGPEGKWLVENVVVEFTDGTKKMHSCDYDNSFGMVKEILKIFGDY